MALNLGGILQGVGGILGGIQGGNAGGVRALGGLLSVGGQIASSISPVPAMTKRPQLPTNKPGIGLQGPKMGAAVGRGFFQKYPNLATAIQRFRNAGMSQVTRSRLHGMLRRFGPELLISGGILTAAAVSELMMAGPGHRRMNPANVKALRRSMRRLDSFHKLCVSTDKLRRPRSRGCKSKGGGTQFVRQG